MTAADREGLGVDRDALRQEMARRGFAGWYGRDEYDDHPVQGMWERTADAQLAGPRLSAALVQADSFAQAVAERDEARTVVERLSFTGETGAVWRPVPGWTHMALHGKLEAAQAETTRLSAEVEARDKRIAELSETWTDEGGTVWSPPTAWAYAKACAALDKRRAQVEALRAALDEAEACLSIVEPRTGRAEYMRTLDVIRAALARTAGKDKTGDGKP